MAREWDADRVALLVAEVLGENPHRQLTEEEIQAEVRRKVSRLPLEDQAAFARSAWQRSAERLAG